MLPGDKNDYVQKVPKLLPAAAFVRKTGVMVMAEYNGIVMIQVNNLSGSMEADEVKKWVKELPQTYLAFVGSSGKAVKIWARLLILTIFCQSPASKRECFMRTLIGWR